MANTIVLFHGELDTLNVFTDQLSDGFKLLNYDIYVIDLNQSLNSLSNFYAYIKDNEASSSIVAMVGFNSAFFGFKTPSGVNVWEQLGIPCINILVDHPYWYRDILSNMPSNSMAICIDRNHMNYVNRFYQNIAGSGFIAHGGTPHDCAVSSNCADVKDHDSNGQIKEGASKEGNIKPLADRKIDVLYAGSLYADMAAVQRPDFSSWQFDADKVCAETIEYLLNDRSITIEAAIEETLIKHKIQLDESELCDFISDCVYIERIVSSHFRERILASVANSGISLTLYGSGWDRCDWIKLSNVDYLGMISPSEVLDKMNDSKVVLNTMPWFKDGSHERVFNGMLRGCVVASEESIYLKELIPEEAWFHFDISDNDIEELPRQLKTLLDDNVVAQKIADAGYAFAINGQTWQDRAQELHEGILQYL